MGKLERELYRTFHQQNLTHKADHFYNFCITANAMKDYFFEATNVIDNSLKKPMNDYWSEIPELVAASEIGNTAKHFVLRHKNGNPKVVQTKSVRESSTDLAHIFLSTEDDVKVELVANAPDFTVELWDGRTHGLYEFMDSVVKFWVKFLEDKI